jgi:hypothetical protein
VNHVERNKLKHRRPHNILARLIVRQAGDQRVLTSTHHSQTQRAAHLPTGAQEFAEKVLEIEKRNVTSGHKQ